MIWSRKRWMRVFLLRRELRNNQIIFMNENKMLVIKPYQLKTLIGSANKPGWLNIPLHGKDVKARNAVFKEWMKVMDVVEEKRQAIIDKYAELQDALTHRDGVTVSKKQERIVENGNYRLSDPDAFQKEYEELMDKEETFEITPELKESYSVVKKLILEGMHRGYDFNEGIILEEIEEVFRKI